MSNIDDFSHWSATGSAEAGDATPEHEPETGSSEPGTAADFPWPPRDGESAIAAFFRTWQRSTFDPTRFFRALPVPGRVPPDLIYFLIVSVVVAGINLFWQSLANTLLYVLGLDASGAEAAPEFMMPLIQFLLTPLFAVIGLVIGAGVHHLFLLIFGGARRGFQTTMRVVAFTASPAIFAIIPIFGGLIGAVWAIVLAIIGLREAHRTDGWRAALAVLVPIAILFVLGLIAAVTLGFLAARMAL